MATQQGPVILEGPCVVSCHGGHGDRARAWCITNFNDDSINQLMRRLNWVVYEHRPGEIRTHHWIEDELRDSVDDWKPYTFD